MPASHGFRRSPISMLGAFSSLCVFSASNDYVWEFVIAKRSADIVFVIGIGQRISQSMSMLLIPLWVLQMHGSAFALGVDVAAVSLATMVLGIPIGAAADRIGSRNIVLFGSIIAAASTMLSVTDSNVWLFGFWQMVAGLGRSATWIGAQTTITRASEDANSKAKRIGWLSLSAQIGNFGGPFLAGFLVSKVNITVAFIVASLAIASVSIATRTGNHDTGAANADSESREKDVYTSNKHFGRAFGLLKLPPFRFIIVSSVVRLFLIAIRNSFYVVYLHQQGFDPLVIGIVLSLGSAASAGAAALTGTLHKRFATKRLLNASIIAMCLAFSFIPFVSSIYYQGILMVVFGLGNGLSQSAQISMIAQATPVNDQGLAVGLRTSINRAVQVSAPLLFGVIVSAILLPNLLFISGVASLASLVGSLWRYRRVEPKGANDTY